jgi:PST family polysaccharide transporter
VSLVQELSTEVQAQMLRRQSVAGGLATLLAQGARFLIKLASQILIARLLVPADYGLIAMTAPVIGLVQLVGDLGLGQAAIRQPDIKQEELSSLFWLGLAINIGISVIVVLLSPLLAQLYREPRVIVISIALAGLIPISGLSTQPAALLSRHLRFGILALLDVAPALVGFVSGFSAAWNGWGYWSLIVSTASETVVFVLLVWSVSGWHPSFNASAKLVRPFVRMGGGITAFNLTQYVTTSFDNMLIAFAQGPTALGLYDKAYQTVVQPIGLLLTPTNRIAVPLLARLLQRPAQYKRTYLSMVQLGLLFGGPGILCVLVISKDLMHFLLGTKWNGIAPVVSWLCLGGFASVLYSSASWLFVSQGRPGPQFKYGLATSMVSVASFAAGLPWGPAGVAAGAGLSFFLICTPLTCWGATQVGPVKFGDLAFAILPIFTALVATAALLFGITRLVFSSSWTMLICAFIFSYGTCFGILFCIPSGRYLLKRTWRLMNISK